MRRHWKDFAERAAKAAFAPQQVSEALPHALKRDIFEAPLDAVRSILGGSPQGSLFPEQRIERLEAAREACRGSAAGNALIDSAVAVVLSGLTGDAAYAAALQSTLADNALSALRGIEEHYQREAGARSARYVRDRLDAARQRCDFGSLGAEVMATGKPSREALRLPRHTGLDDGPQL